MEVRLASPHASRPVRALTVLFLVIAGFALQPRSVAQAYAVKKTKSGQSVRWSVDVITLRVDPRLERVFGSDAIRAALAMSTDAWRGLPGVPRIEISQDAAPGYSLEQRTNGVYLMDPWPFPQEQLAVTVSTYTTTGRMIGADILINVNTRYALLPEGDDVGGHQHDLGAVLTHEMGHVLGLDESPDDELATMWPYIRAGEVHQRTLTDDDEQGIVDVYSGPEPDDAIRGCGQMSVAGGARAERSGAALGLLMLCLVLARRAGLREAARRNHSAGLHLGRDDRG